MRAVILDLTRGSADATYWPSGSMVPALGRDDFLLDESHKLLALRQGQAQSRDVAQITGSVDRHHVDAAAQPIDPNFHQAPGAKPTPSLIPSQPKTRLVIPCPPPHPQSLDSLILQPEECRKAMELEGRSDHI